LSRFGEIGDFQARNCSAALPAARTVLASRNPRRPDFLMSQISVVIPTYNRCALVCEAIESAITQTHRPAEVLVIDDGSTDSTKERVSPYVRAGSVRYLRQPNRGVSAARNRGMQSATGQRIAFLDSDDVWMPDHLARLSGMLDARPQAAVAFANFAFERADADVCNDAFRRSIRSLLDTSFEDAGDGLWVSTAALLQGLLTVGFTFRIQGCLISADFARHHALQFDEAVSFTEEAQFVIEAARHTRFVFTEHVSLIVRRDEEKVGDACYADKIGPSYERRIRRMSELFGRTLVGKERKALKYALGKMQVHIMNDTARKGAMHTAIAQGARLLAMSPSYDHLKAVTKVFVRRGLA
jgi:glycosyltransferase involved in cell wall biosynthesis